MKVLVINAGSSSLKYLLMDMEKENVICKGIAERIGIDKSSVSYKAGDVKKEINVNLKNHTEAMNEIMKLLTNPEFGVIKNVSEITAFGHRVVNVGESYFDSCVITKKVLEDFKKNTDFAPLHVPAHIMGIEACLSIAPKIKNVAVFDTGFHKTMPAYAYRYAIPTKDYKELKIRRYGAHGTSHFYVSQECMKLLKKKHSKIITCHLGNGSSMSAVLDGKCIDTSMGFTPLEGLVMGTRSGDIDPAVVEFLCKKRNITVSDAIKRLNKESGMLGMSNNYSSDMRDLRDKLNNPEVQLAFDVMCYRIKKYIGSYIAVLGGVDAIAFAGGVGENDSIVREKCLEGLECFGIKLNKKLNNDVQRFKENTNLTGKGSKVKIFVIPTNEELVIARETISTLKLK